MHDGQNLFNNSQAAFGTAWLVQNTLNQLADEGKMREIIVVGIWNTADRINEYTYSYDPSEKTGGKGAKYLDFIEQELLPIVEGDWLKDRIRGSYGIAGSSLGGLISCYAAYTRPTKFAKAACMSSSFWWNNEDFNSKVISTQKLYSGLQLYLDSGDSGTSQDGKDQTVTVYQHFSKIGYKVNQTLFYYLDKGGQHSEAYWGKRFYIPMIALYP
jgi:predicted alpha/beta superfamily hydrolase